MMKQGYNEDWINQIRLEIYEEIKDMTSEEKTEYFMSAGDRIATEFGIKITPSLGRPQCRHTFRAL
ncbi:MAG: hypothetical protein LBK56_00255 [Gracilibacteraceae bacterium]|jgi:hypothetical protein|nr:hypothetical protein [Gracilibacteraceae bacterium]